MLDQAFILKAQSHLHDAADGRLAGFVEFARLASRFFPGYFEALGFSREEAEDMTVDAIHGIETDLPNLSSSRGVHLENWLSSHLNRVVRASIGTLNRASRELAMAEELQTLTFTVESMPGATAWVSFRPAGVLSGDFCDRVSCQDGTFIVAVGDASGKGAAAAMYATLALGLLRAYAVDSSAPEFLMQRINEGLRLRRPDGEQYVTLLLASWEPASRNLTLCSSGGCYPLRMPLDGLEIVPLNGQWLGTHSVIEPDQALVVPDGHEILALYSDGITDQFDSSDCQFGVERLALTIAREYDAPLHMVADAIFEDIDAFRGEHVLTDDQTVVLLRFAPLSA
jgi:serine phosphatase RsbU (regulator of sigma subunit)